MNKIIESSCPVIIFIRGLPGSGKSFLASELKKILGDDITVLDPDTIDINSKEYARHVEKCKSEGVDEVLFPYRFLRGQAYQAIRDNEIVIWNQPFTNLEIFNKMVANLRIQANENKTELMILVVEMEISDEVAKERVISRKSEGGHGPSVITFNRFINDYESFKNDGYNTVTVFGEDDVKESVQKVLDAINELLLADQ
jgi:adenylate kinase family enzyme